jgi:phage host-nuclease inhibitor protein Gam
MAADYARRQREENPKYKGEKTPYGKISFRKQQTEWKYTDEAALVQYLEDNGHVELVRTKKEPIKTELKKMLLVTETGAVVDPTTGEIVPSVTATERPDAVDIKVEG